MIRLDRRVVIGGLASTLAASRACAQPRTVQDGAGRAIAVPATVERVFPAGPPAAIMLYTLAPDLLLGWPRALPPDERAFLLPEIAARPEVGRLTGRGNTANLEVVLQVKPDLILDVGTVSDTYTSLADRVQAQTGIAYALLDGRLDTLDAAYRTLGALVGREQKAAELAAYAKATLDTVRERIAKVPENARPRVYYARGAQGLETGLAGSINVESITVMGARNVAAERRGGLANVSLEQVLAWNPEVIVTIDSAFAGGVRSDPAWASVAAVQGNRVHLAPRLPFGWVDFPPSVNRLIGLRWLGRVLYPDLFPEDIRPLARDFYRDFYHVSVSDEDLTRVLAG
jgi:iron complex transport system substrate-binding protein